MSVSMLSNLAETFQSSAKLKISKKPKFEVSNSKNKDLVTQCNYQKVLKYSFYFSFFRGLKSVFFCCNKQLYWHFYINRKLLPCRKTEQRKFREKKFVDSGIVKTCDELNHIVQPPRHCPTWLKWFRDDHSHHQWFQVVQGSFWIGHQSWNLETNSNFMLQL